MWLWRLDFHATNIDGRWDGLEIEQYVRLSYRQGDQESFHYELTGNRHLNAPHLDGLHCPLPSLRLSGFNSSWTH